MTETPSPHPEPAAEPEVKQHGDPLLDSAQGRNDGDDGSRHGADATHAEDVRPAE
jgi:hypothetical protein